MKINCDAPAGGLPACCPARAHELPTSMRSEASYVTCSAVLGVVASTFREELNAHVDAFETSLYIIHVYNEKLYAHDSDSSALTYFQSTLGGTESGPSSRRSRQVELKLRKARQIIMDGEITAGHVVSKNKISDLFIKHLDIEQSQFISPSPLWVTRSLKPITPQREYMVQLRGVLM